MSFRSKNKTSPVKAAREMRKCEAMLEVYDLSCVRDYLVDRGMLPHAAERSVEAYRAFMREMLWGDRFKAPTTAAKLALHAHLIHEAHFRHFIGEVFNRAFSHLPIESAGQPAAGKQSLDYLRCYLTMPGKAFEGDQVAADTAVRNYQAYLAAGASDQPSTVVRTVWEAHLLHTEDYRRFKDQHVPDGRDYEPLVH